MSVARETGAAADPAVARETPRPGLLTALMLLPIRLYRRFLSPALGQRCRYYPTCSAYAEEAVRELGPVRGMILAAWRLLRCNPFSPGGLDPVAERRIFRAAHTHTRATSR
ncbi:MAG TPA: membrane protein insertion efficiency factor YidD [Solirubrobacterales bacterium]|nr:membrane protein insertion efficiency factor YidD [Solirubrobacterales bacterium]